MLRIIASFAAIGIVTAASAAIQSEPLKEGEGKEIVAVACAQCHPVSTVTHLRMGENAWRRTVNYMIARGAQLTPANADRAVRYLATSYGPGTELPHFEAPPVTLAEGAGKELVEAQCSLCHDMARSVGTRRTAVQWQQMVDKMVYYGSPLDGPEKAAVVTYLTTHYSTPRVAAKDPVARR